MSARRPLIRAPLLVAFVATMSLGAVELVRNWPEAKTPPAPRTGTVAWLAQAFERLRHKAEPDERADLQLLLELLRDNPTDRDAATMAMLDQTRSPRSSMREAALNGCQSAMMWLDDLQPSTLEATWQRCLELLDDDARPVRLQALSTYIWPHRNGQPATCAPKVVTFIGSLLQSSEEADRAAGYMACHFIGEVSAPLLPLLRDAPQETSKPASFFAVLAMHATGDTSIDSLLWLREQLAHPEPDVRQAAAGYIGDFGERGTLLVPELLALLADAMEADDVARSAAHALAELPIAFDVADEALTLLADRALADYEVERELVTRGKLARRASLSAAAPIHAELTARITGDSVLSDVDAHCALAHLVCTHGTDAERQRLADLLFDELLEEHGLGIDQSLMKYADALVALANAPSPPRIDLPKLCAAIACTAPAWGLHATYPRRLLARLPQ